MSKWMGLALAALLACGLVAVPAFAESRPAPKQPGVLRVIDEAKMFSTGAVKSAESQMRSVRFDHGLTLVIDTHPELPAERKTEFEKAKDNAAKAAIFDAWAHALYTGDKAEGIYVLVCKSPGAVVVLTDKETRNRGFTKDNENALRDLIRTGLKDAAAKPEAERPAARDAVLKSAVDHVVADLKGTAVTTTSDGEPLAKTTRDSEKAAGRSVGGWICIGLCVLLGVWLVIGLIRAFTGGGGGGYGGGGGGGFGSSLLGGLFGAMAGMWLYNSMFGGGMMGGGSDAMASDGSTGAEGDTGAGDLADDTGGGGYDGGDYGGGDTGGGGDFSGGGDFGGGGGDFGGDF